LAYLINPWQDRYCSFSTLSILLNKDIKEQINSQMKYYDLILPHVVKNIAPLNLDKMLVYEKS
jgi:hypothetical protein